MVVPKFAPKMFSWIQNNQCFLPQLFLVILSSFSAFLLKYIHKLLGTMWLQASFLLCLPPLPLFPENSGTCSSEPVGLVQLLSHVWLFATPWTAAHQSSLSLTDSWSLLKLMSIELVMPSNHLILCHSLSSCLPSFPASGSFLMSQFFASGGQSIGASAPALVLPMNIQDWFPLDWLVWSPCSPRDSQESSPAPQFKSINSWALILFLVSNSHIHTWLLEKP